MKGFMNRYHLTLFAVFLMVWMLLSVSVFASDAPMASYTYDVSADGPVHVTIRPGDVRTILIPVTAENIKASDMTYDLAKDWELFRYTVNITQTGDNPTLSYDWPEGALPWPVKNSDYLQESDKKWFTDTFWVAGPAEVTIILPEGAEPWEIRDRDLPHRQETGSDGRIRVVFTIQDNKIISWKETKNMPWMGLVYKFPWANKYSVYGKSPLPLYYPTVLGKYPEYMTKLKEFYAANEEFYATYEKRMKFVPPHDISINIISWIQGYGGAYTAGKGVYYNYRGITSFEWPPIKFGGNLMGAYHEMAHAFQPICAPWYIGGHTWTAYWTMDYDYNCFPTIAEVVKKKQEGVKPDDWMRGAYEMFKAMREQGLVPGLWYKWPEDDPKIKSFPGMEKYYRGAAEMQELASAYVQLTLAREFGDEFWGKYYKTCLDLGASTDIDEPIQQKLVAALISRAAGKDLTSMLEKLTGCDLTVTLDQPGDNLIVNGGMEEEGSWKLDAWQKDAVMSWDDEVSRSGKRSLRLDCPAPNDAHIDQVIKLKPNTPYILTAWIKTKDIGNGTSGASLCLFPGNASRILRGTNDWQKIVFPIYSGDTGEVTVGLRIGWFSEPTAGTAWIDDVELIPLFSEKGWKQLLPDGR